MKRTVNLLVIIGMLVLVTIYFGRLWQRAVTGLGKCLDVATNQINDDLAMQAQADLEKNVMCARLSLQNESLRNCYELVGRQSMVPVVLVERYLKLLNPRFPLLSEQLQSQERICGVS